MKRLKAYMLPIRFYRIKAKMTQTELAQKVGVTTETISQWELGKNRPQTSYLEKLSDALGVPTQQLYTEIYASDSAKIDRMFPIDKKKRILIYGSISAGKPTFAQEEIEDYTYTDLSTDGEKLFGLRVKGDSMNLANLPNGCVAIVKQCSWVENGAIAVVRIDEEDATVKRFYQDGRIVRLEPCSSNPEHQEQVYDLSKVRVSIIGEVIGCEIKFNR